MSDLFAIEQESATGAVFSPCRKYRYLLWRVWDKTLPHATFCMMNGSTADEIENDPTVERCVRRVKKWQAQGTRIGGAVFRAGGVKVVNAFGWRETDSSLLPKLVADGIDINGPENDTHIVQACLGAAVVICGWGVPGHTVQQRGPAVLAMMKRYGISPYALKINTDGSPQHPLYIGYDVVPVPL